MLKLSFAVTSAPGLVLWKREMSPAHIMTKLGTARVIMMGALQDLYPGKGTRPGFGLPCGRERQRESQGAAIHCTQDYQTWLSRPCSLWPLLVCCLGLCSAALQLLSSDGVALLSCFDTRVCHGLVGSDSCDPRRRLQCVVVAHLAA